MSSSPEVPSLDATIGLLILAGLLWGTSAVQLYYYIEEYVTTDKWQLQAYVIFIWALDTVHQGILCRMIYVLFVKHFADVSSLNHIPENTSSVVVLQAVVDTLVQILFVVRIWHLSNKSVVLTGLNALLIAALLSINLVFFGKSYGFSSFEQLASIQNIITALNSLITVVDSVIAITLVILLQRRRSAYKSTDSVVKRLIMYSISTGLITGIWSIIGLVGVVAMPKSNLDVFVDLVLPRLYVNCMFASLNSRASLRNELSDGSARGKSIHLTTFEANIRTDETVTLANENPSQSRLNTKVEKSTINSFDRKGFIFAILLEFSYKFIKCVVTDSLTQIQ
ncbi:uncharacterized protein FOMMEDRAFT_136449 [Fomitiporia mediterranea MF3/22]|uniref:uncharacterized protein n=1 Tax=Fomitiporia mediterranea (strain MF3/22) TaxID=694068 RepID=UPI0004409B3E|nr:uncharacterized protein FOMMEDRAFT_136449 [Fomitiporia mediterranea MF3/22]EJC99900.1 hypothetical protein FOMMEDRAFT_136449 [Fomitiporia mediterranea MF3/22]